MSDIATSLEFKILNITSAACALLVVLIILYIKRFRSEVIETPMANLQLAIGLMDMIRHVILSFTFSHDRIICNFLAFWNIFSTQSHVMANIFISYNLQSSLKDGTTPIKQAASCTKYVVATMILDLLPLGLGAYGVTDKSLCFLSQESNYLDFFNFILFYLPCAPGYLYCICVFIIVSVRAITRSSVNDIEAQAPLLENSHEFEAYYRPTRISFYPLSCILCHSGAIALTFSKSFGIEFPDFFAWCLLGKSSIGVANLAAFILDVLYKQFLHRKFEEFLQADEPQATFIESTQPSQFITPIVRPREEVVPLGGLRPTPIRLVIPIGIPMRPLINDTLENVPREKSGNSMMVTIKPGSKPRTILIRYIYMCHSEGISKVF